MQLEFSGCILSKFYIKPQLRRAPCKDLARCILSKFYIKPQHLLLKKETLLVVSYRNSTSNHNHQRVPFFSFSVVSYRNSTSNHNLFGTNCMYNELYLIEILHQTTTRPSLSWLLLRCILSKFYIKPQLVPNSTDTSYGCILSKFYIKPQQRVRHTLGHSVVSYRNSTSNHNIRFSPPFFSWLYLIEILHQTTTQAIEWVLRMCCILSKFYIKPQQCPPSVEISASCILSKFYIKPQLRR